MFRKYPKLLPALLVCIVVILGMAPAAAQDNPYQSVGEISPFDIPVAIVSDTVPMTGSSGVYLDGANYTHTIGRVSITMRPLISGLNMTPVSSGNTLIIGDTNVVKYDFYRGFIKEHVILTSPETVRYSYDISLSDWVTLQPDFSRPEITRNLFGDEVVSYPHMKEVTSNARDSTAGIVRDEWGNLVFVVNGADVAVLPRPFAIDATGKRFDLDFALDTSTKTITVTGDMPGAQYPVDVDPSERVTNGGFETGTADGWMAVGNPAPTLTIASGDAYEGSYYCLYQGNGPMYGLEGYNRIYQEIDYTGVTSASMALRYYSNQTYNFVMSDMFWDTPGNYRIIFDNQPADGWVFKSATPTLSGSHLLQVWTYAFTYAGLDSISATSEQPPTPTQTPTITPTPTSTSAVENGNTSTVINATIPQQISVAITNPFTGTWSLSPGFNSLNYGNLTVTANVPWSESTSATNGDHLRSGGNTPLTNKLQLNFADVTAYTVSGNSSSSTALNFAQVVTMNDPAGSYGTVVTFTVNAV